MFQLQTGVLESLRGEWGDSTIDLFQKVLGDCAQPLLHNGPVTFTNSVKISNCGDLALVVDDCGGTVTIEGEIVNSGTTASLRYAKALGGWVNQTGNDSYVDCVTCADRDGTASSSPTSVRVYLPRSGGNRDPNVQIDDVITFATDASGDNVATSGYLDDPIGRVKIWIGDVDNIPRGWRALSSTAGRVVAGYSSGDSDFGSMEGTGGTATEAAHSGLTSGSAGAGTSGNASPGLVIGAGGGATASTSGTTATTNVTGSLGSADPVLQIDGTLDIDDEPELFETSSEPADIVVEPHTQHTHTVSIVATASTLGLSAVHTVATVTSVEQRPSLGSDVTLNHNPGDAKVNDPTHDHTVYSDILAAAFDVPDHTHTWTQSGGDHLHTWTSRTLTIDGHTHTVVGGSHNHSTSDHTHAVSGPAHTTNGNFQPFLVVLWIERYA